MNINELFADALRYDESLLAHTLYSGLKDGSIEGTNSVDADLYDRIDLEKGYQLHRKNFLGLNSAKLFASPIGNGKFAMIFAEDEKTARKIYKKEFRAECGRMHLLHYGLDVSTYDLETKEHQTWREYRDSLPELPAFAGIFEKDWIVIRREEDAKNKSQQKSA